MGAREYDLPLIAPGAIDAYLERPAADFDFLKRVPRAELLAHVRDLGFRYVTEPRNCQLVGNIIGAQQPHFLYYLDMGAGKSKMLLDLIRWRKRRGELQRAIILAPELVHLSSWEDQIAEHAPDLKHVTLLGDRSTRFALIDRKADIYLLNYAGLQVYMSERKSHKQRLEQDSAAEFASLFNLVLFEEVHRIRSHTSLTFRLCCWMASAAAFRYATTGTPFGRDPMMLWPQFKMVDDGETFASLGLFRAAFFSAHKRKFGKKFAGYDFAFREDRASALHRLMRNRSIVYDEQELAHDLPGKSPLRVPVRMTSEQALYYRRIVDRMKEARGDYRSLDNVFTRMRQCASGFLALKADDESRIEVRLDPNPKLEALRQVLCDLPAGDKVLIFHQYTYSGNVIRALLEEMGVGFASLHGGVKDLAAEYRRFLEQRSCWAFVLQNQSGSEAINPQGVCRYSIFYERPDDPIISQQAEKRTYRPGQKRRTFFIDLTVLGTVEEKLLRYLKEARDIRKAILSGEETLS